MRMAKVTVVIPVYNVEKYLRECLDSVCSQTLSDLQILCVDDCSPDNCGAILDEYAAGDSRITVFHLEKNRMQGYGRNLGLDHAQGEYIYFLDSDDMIEPDAMRILYDRCAPDGIEAAVFGYRNIYETEDLRKMYPQKEFIPEDSPCRDRVCTGSELLDDMMIRQYWTPMPQVYFWKTEMLKREGVRCPEGAYHEDEYFSFAALLSAERATCVPETLSIRRIRGNSVVTSHFDCRNAYGYLNNYRLMNRFALERNIHTYGSVTEIGIMIWMFKHLSKKLDHDELRAYCSRTEEDRIAFESLISTVYQTDYSRFLYRDMLKTAEAYRKVTVYGTGEVGRQFANALKMAGGCIRPARYIATRPLHGEETFMGAPVVPLDTYEQEDGEIVVAAVSYKELLSARRALNRRGIRWIYYTGGKTGLLKKIIRALKNL